MTDATISPPGVDVDELRSDVLAPSLWVLAILAWGVGDYATTHYALAFVPGAYESTPLVARILDASGAAGHAGFKAFTFAFAAVYYQRLPIVAADRFDAHEDRVRAVLLAIPLAFALAGFALTLGNLDVILSGGSA